MLDLITCCYILLQLFIELRNSTQMESTEIQTATKDETIKTQKAGFSAKTANMLDKIIQPSDRNSQALKERRLHRRIGAITRPHSEILDQMTYGRVRSIGRTVLFQYPHKLLHIGNLRKRI